MILVLISTSYLVFSFQSEPQFTYCIEPNEQVSNADGYCAFYEKNYGNIYFRCQSTPGAPGQQMDCIGNLLNAEPITE